MDRTPIGHLLWRNFQYLLFSLGLIFASLLPLNFTPDRLVWPDMVKLLTFAIALRRPDYVSLWLIAAIYLFCDVIYFQPLGVAPFSMVIVTYWLILRAEHMRDASFLQEWVFAAVAILASVIICKVIMAITLLPAVDMTVTVIQTLLSILCYPFMVGLLRLIGLRKAALGEVDQLGHRI